jgi:NTP pyrophosphatase (non-canonical NTP hydrolase)
MAIECYNGRCEFHSAQTGVDEGPFCHESECLIDMVTGEQIKHKVTSNNYAELAAVTEAPITEEMKHRIIRAIPHISDIFEEQIMLSIRLDLLKKFIFYGKGEIESTGDPAHHLHNRHQILDEQVIRLLHCAIGMATETGELMEALKNHIYDGLPLDEANIGEELGDGCWYIGIGADAIRKSLTDILATNNSKLRHRFPDKFTEYHAENRDLEGERAILEGALQCQISKTT